VGELERSYPSAAACLAQDLPALCVHLSYPLRLRRRLRSTNLLERSLEEVKRRTKVIGRFPGETNCLSLCWAVLDLFIATAQRAGADLTGTPPADADVGGADDAGAGDADRVKWERLFAEAVSSFSSSHRTRPQEKRGLDKLKYGGGQDFRCRAVDFLARRSSYCVTIR
jgi:mutator family transposase